jgi:hypothetical protein
LAETTRRVRELEAAVVDIEGKLKLARAEAKVIPLYKTPWFDTYVA